MNRLLHIITAIFTLTSVALAGDTAITHVDAKGAAKLIEEKKVTVIDVRTQNEFADGHIEGAKVIDFTEDDFKTKVAALDKATPYLVHCAAGGRSTKALDTFKKLGFSNITHLDGGLNAWTAAGLKLTK